MDGAWYRPAADVRAASNLGPPYACSQKTTAHGIVEDLKRDLAGPPLAFVLAFVSPRAATDELASQLSEAFGETPVIGCTTAGEISPDGYLDGAVTAIGFPSACFAITACRISPLSKFSIDQGGAIASSVLTPSGVGQAALWPDSFALMLVDGLSCKEDALLASIAPALCGVPLIGGSAGDGLDFEKSRILHGGAFHNDAALLAHVRTRCDVQTFHFNHFIPTARRMVITRADPSARLVHEINAEPAAREYARIVGKDPEQLSPFIFAEHPVVVRIGDQYYVRAIQKVEENGDLRFFCAVDEGLVLTVATAGDIVSMLDSGLSELTREREPSLILGFDCVLRRLEAERSQKARQVSNILSAYNVRGFCTYGEQFSGLHLNQTMTGLAIYPPSG